ncbi:TPA: hypothetical protein DEP94_03550 [Candidatus Nomurabacteria bacterium]|nr:hypothetical protein [Candidatus Nomurabacteria bacterium]
MKTIPFDISFLETIAKSFVDSFPGWSEEKATEYLKQNYLTSPEFCYMSVDENDEFLGGIFCKVGPNNKESSLILESLQVLDKYRNKGVGTALLHHVINKAQEKGITNISMLSPTQNEFPMSWYKKMGFKETGWIELSTNISEINTID